MSLIFVVFLLLLATFLLLTFAAGVRSGWHYFCPPTAASSGKSGVVSPFSDCLLLIGVATAWYAVAMGWGGQIAFYPLYLDFSLFPQEEFQALGHGYLSRLPPLLLPIAAMCVAWSLLLWFPSHSVPKRTVWAIVSLCVGFVAVTPFSAFAQDRMLVEGFTETVYSQLMWSNGARSVIFTAIGLLSLAAVRSRWVTPSTHKPDD
jgi:hypothetical protein